MTEHDTQHMGAATFAVLINHRGSGSKVDLGFFSRSDFDPAKWQRRLVLELAEMQANVWIAAGETIFDDQVLVHQLGRKALLKPAQDSFPIRLAEAAGPGGRFAQNGWF